MARPSSQLRRLKCGPWTDEGSLLFWPRAWQFLGGGNNIALTADKGANVDVSGAYIQFEKVTGANGVFTARTDH